VVQKSQEGSLYQGYGTILLMDDERGIRETAGEMLRMLGFEVEYARSGEEALKCYQQKQAEGKPYKLVILDKTVRGGMGGEKTMEKLLFIDPDVKALISSGYANASLLSECEKYGFQGYVSKPYKIEELSSLLQEIL
jgi:DNA-binding NtrC family response regulator